MSKKILLADDSVTIRKVVELTFMEEDYELETTTDGREALARLEDGAPDLVIADVHMPEVGGLDVARESKAKYPQVPVLLLVGTFEPFDPADVDASGADEFLKKPFDSQDLLRQVSRLLERTPAQKTETPVAGDAGEEVADGPGATAETDGDYAFDSDSGDTLEEKSEPTESVEAREAATVPLADEDVERIARRVSELLADGAIRDVAWEVVPDMAEVVIKERLRELEDQVE